ncbi:MAG: hypothetical protein ACHQDB_10505 [Steroidobacterales bacterium]
MQRQFIASIFLIALVACSQQDLVQKFASPAEQSVARQYIDLLRQQQYEAIEAAMDPSLGGPSMHGTLVSMAAVLPAGQPTSVTLIGARRFKASGSETVNLTFEYNFSGKWIVANVAVKRNGGNTTIVGFNIYPQPNSLERQNRFTLRGKSAFQYLVLGLAVILPLFTLFALVTCVRTKLKGRKWPWVLFVIFGIGKVAVNWTTGQWGYSFLNAQLFSAGAFAPLYGQWTIFISIPVGAIVFLARRKQLKVAVEP